MNSVTKAMKGLDLDVDTLRHCLEALPQELYNQIHDAVFTAPPGIRNLTNPRIHYERGEKEIDWYDVARKRKARRRLLNPLHVSSATRAMYAKSFYAGHFQFDVFWNSDSDSCYCRFCRSVQSNLRGWDSTDFMGEIYGKWLKMLPKEHLDLVKIIMISAEQVNDLGPQHCSADLLSWSVLRYKGRAVAAKVYLKCWNVVYCGDGYLHEWTPHKKRTIIINPKVKGYVRELAKTVGY